jgi:formate-dependent nitrite reductase membrane component NrfD
MVPGAQPRSYYGQPVLKAPVWTWEIPAYFFIGGLAGASSALAFSAQLTGNKPLARRAWLTAFASISASPALLISDLGKPSRFLNMLRVFKVTSPMSVGSWLLVANGGVVTLAAAHEMTGRLRYVGPVAGAASAVLGLPLSSYTAVLLANTAVPVWHEGRRELPFVFAGSAGASAGAAATVLTPNSHAGPARRLTVGTVLMEAIVMERMEHRLGLLAEPYRNGRASRIGKTAKVLSRGGAALVALAGQRRRGAAALGGAMVLAGAACRRFAILQAGFQSSRDPKYTVEPQRRSLETR